MADDNDSTLKIKADISSLKAELQTAGRLIRLANSEFKAATAGMSSWSTSADGLNAKIKQLNTVLDQEKVKLSNLKQQYDLVSHSEGENSAAAQRLAIQINNQEAAIKKTESQLERYKTDLDNIKDASEDLGDLSALDKQRKSIEQTESDLTKLKEKYTSLQLAEDKAGDESEDLAQEIQKLSTKLKEDKAALEAAENAADKLDNSLDDTGKSAKEAEDGFTTMKATLANLAAEGIKKCISGFVDLGKKALEAGMNFESGMSKVAAISGATGDDLTALRNKAKELGSTTKFTATESAEAMQYMAMAGWKTDDMLDGLKGVMNLAAASGEDLSTTSDIVTDSLTAFGLTAKDTDEYVDLLASAATNTNTNVSMMGETFKYAAPAAGALGYTAKDTATAIGLMANGGIKASQAGTSLRSGLLSLAKPGKQAAAVMDKYNLSLTDSSGQMKPFSDLTVELRKKLGGLDKAEQTAALSALVGKNAYSGWANVINATQKDFDKTTDAMNNSSGAAQKMADTMNDNVAGKITLLKSQLEGAFINVFEKAAPQITKGINAISTAISSMDIDKVSNDIGNIASIAGKLFSGLISNIGTIKNLIIGVGGSFAAMFAVDKIQTFVTSIQGGTGLLKTFTTAVNTMRTAETAATTATAALGVAQAALPIAAISIAIGTVLVGALKKHNENVQAAIDQEYGLSKAAQDNIKSIDENAQAYKRWDDARKESVSSADAEYNTIYDLKDAYNSLVDSNGKIAKGKQDTANIIKGQLADALGVEKSKINDLIDANGKLSDSIDKLIEKRRAQAVLEASKDSYTDALKNRQKAIVDNEKAQSNLAKAQQKHAEFTKKHKDIIDAYNAATHNGTNEQTTAAVTTGIAQNKIIKAYKASQKSVEENKKAVADSGKQISGYASSIKNYEDLAAAIAGGNQAKIKSALENQVNNFVTAKNGTKAVLEQQVKDYTANYNALKNALAKGTGGVTKQQVKEAANMVSKSKKELAKLSPAAKKEATKAGKAHAKGLQGTTNANKKAASQVSKKTQNEIKKGVPKFTKLGKTAGSNHAKGINSTKGKNKSAGSAIGKNAVTGAGSHKGKMSSTGKSAGESFASGVKNKKSAANKSGSALGSAAVDGVKSKKDDAKKAGSAASKAVVDGGKGHQGDMKSVGSGLAGGLLKGIGSRSKELWDAGKAAVKKVIAGGKKEAKVKSPSKVTTKDGQNIAAGYVVGLSSKNTVLAKAGASAVSTIIKAATKEAQNTKYARAISKAFMKSVASEQTSFQNLAKNTALDMVKTTKSVLLNLDNWNFATIADKATSTFSSQLTARLNYVTAKLEYKNNAVLDSLQKTINANEKSKATAGKNAVKPYDTQIKKYQDALKKSNDKYDKKIKKASTDKAKDRLKTAKKDQQKHYKALIADEKKARKKALNASNKKWDKTININKAKQSNYTKASEKMMAQLQSAMSDFQSKAESLFTTTVTNITDKYNAQYDELISKQDELINKMKSYGELFEISSANVITLEDLEQQTKDITDYYNKLAKIKPKISSDLFDQITSYDLDQASAYLDQLLKMTSKQLTAYDKAYSKKLSESNRLGKSIYASQFDTIEKNYKDAITKAVKNLPSQLEDLGKQAMKGFVDGLTTNTNYMTKAIKEYAAGIVAEFKKNFKIASPSKVMIQIGEYVGQGLPKGLNNTVREAQLAAERLSSAVVSPFNNLTLPLSATQGLKNGQNQVINNYNLVQNNTSPKPLTALDTYKARRKQISMIKAVK